MAREPKKPILIITYKKRSLGTIRFFYETSFFVSRYFQRRELVVNRQISNLFTCDCVLATNTTLKPEFYDYLLGRFLMKIKMVPNVQESRTALYIAVAMPTQADSYYFHNLLETHYSKSAG